MPPPAVVQGVLCTHHQVKTNIIRQAEYRLGRYLGFLLWFTAFAIDIISLGAPCTCLTLAWCYQNTLLSSLKSVSHCRHLTPSLPFDITSLLHFLLLQSHTLSQSKAVQGCGNFTPLEGLALKIHAKGLLNSKKSQDFSSSWPPSPLPGPPLGTSSASYCPLRGKFGLILAHWILALSWVKENIE